MGFFMGLLVGLVTGAAGAVLYTVQTGRDLRQEFELMRSEVQQRDFEALGKHLEDRFRELQAGLEERIGQARDAASKAADDAVDAARSTVESADETATSTMD
jgi:gas vesicle protein